MTDSEYKKAIAQVLVGWAELNTVEGLDIAHRIWWSLLQLENSKKTGSPVYPLVPPKPPGPK